MTELQELMKQKKEIEKRIKILTTGSVINEDVKIDRITYAGKYQRGKWALFFKYRHIVSKGWEGTAEYRTKWQPLFNEESFDDVVKRIPYVIQALTDLYEETKGAEHGTDT